MFQTNVETSPFCYLYTYPQIKRFLHHLCQTLQFYITTYYYINKGFGNETFICNRKTSV